MAEIMVPDSRRCNYFFLYDGSKVKGEADRTMAGICCFYPEETPLDKQELLCGQVAGVARCVSELSSSPVRMLRLRHSKFAIRMKDDFLWALGCSVEVPNVSICDLLDQLISLFCFYNGSVRQSYQIYSRETLAVRWAQYLSHLQAGSTELHHIFSCLSTIDSTHIDPLLLLKAALILQACQRCPLVLAGCILFRGRVVSTQMTPDLTVKVMVHEAETYNKEQRPNGLGSSSSSGGASLSSDVTSTSVFLTPAERQYLHSYPVDRESRSHSTPNKPSNPRKTRLSRTLSDTPSSGSDASEPEASRSPPVSQQVFPSDTLLSGSHNLLFRPSPSQSPAGSLTSPAFQTPLQSLNTTVANGETSHEVEEEVSEESCYHMYCNSGGSESSKIRTEGDDSVHEDASHLNGQRGGRGTVLSDYRRSDLGCQKSGNKDSQEDKVLGEVPPSLSPGDGLVEDSLVPVTPSLSPGDGSVEDSLVPVTPSLSPGDGPVEDTLVPVTPSLSPSDVPVEDSLVPVTLYQHRVRGLVLVLLVEPQFHNDMAAMEEVYHSSLASLNGLEAHLRTTTAGAPGSQGPYIFAHFDCVQNTLTTNLSGRPGGGQERPFVRATSLLHSHFSHTETLQEAIIRNAGTAVFGTRSVAQETYFQQQGGTVRNSGIPNHQDSAFSLPSKARHRLLKHGVNLLTENGTDKAKQ